MRASRATGLGGSGSDDRRRRRRRCGGRDRVRKGPDVICTKRIRTSGIITDDMRKIGLEVCGGSELEGGRPAMILPTGCQS
jgi:hypothetical protein